jgi:hypothetical protein
VGYLIALFFVLYSAPDLVLTQLLIETLTVILLLLVFYLLPGYFEDRSPLWTRLRDLVVAAAVGSEIARGEYGEIPRLIVGGFVIGLRISLIIAYVMGAASALVVGVAVALADRRQRGISLRVALVTALVSWALAAALATTFIPGDALAAWIALLLLAHLLAAVVCTWIARAIFGGR